MNPTTEESVNISGEDFLPKEFDQAWQHYRQNEASRFQYMGLFFAAASGLVGFAITLIRDMASKPEILLPAIMIVGWILFAVTLFVYTAVKRFGASMSYHRWVIDSIREYASCYRGDAGKEFFDGLKKGAASDPFFYDDTFSVQSAMEWILKTVLFLLAAGGGISVWFTLAGRPPFVISSNVTIPLDESTSILVPQAIVVVLGGSILLAWASSMITVWRLSREKHESEPAESKSNLQPGKTGQPAYPGEEA